MNEVRTRIGEGGRVILPAHIRHALHLTVGDDIILQIIDEELHITTPHQALRKLQTMIQNYTQTTDKPISLVDELIATRRAESLHE